MIALGTRIEQVFARKVHPVIVADDLHAGSGGILSAHSVIRKDSLPVVMVRIVQRRLQVPGISPDAIKKEKT